MTWLYFAWLGLLSLFCGLWWGLALGLLRAAAVTGRLAALPLTERANWPALAVIAPARNEAATLREAVRSRLDGDYPNLHVVVVDDRSDDGTGAIADELAEDPRVTALHLVELPEGWLGKLHALQRGVEASEAPWLLLSDADVHVAPGALRRAVAYAEQRGLDQLAVMPRVEPAGPLMAGLHAVFLTMLLVAFDGRRAEDPKSPFAPAVGAFTLLRREALQRTEGFEAIRLCVDDDLQLGLMMKASGARCGALHGAGAVSVDLYPTPWDAVVGAEKNAWGIAGGFSVIRGTAVGVVLPLLFFAPWLLLASAPAGGWQAFAAATGGVLVAASGGALLVNGRAPWGVLLQPLGVLLLAFAMVRGTWKAWRQGGLSWRGTHYPTQLFLDFHRERRAQARAAGPPGA